MPTLPRQALALPALLFCRSPVLGFCLLLSSSWTPVTALPTESDLGDQIGGGGRQVDGPEGRVADGVGGTQPRTAGPERERETLRPLPAGGPRGGPRPLARAAAPRAPSALQSAGAQVPVGWTRLRMCRWPLLLLWGLLPRAAAGGSGWPFPHRTLLDSEGKYWLSWGQRGGRLAFRLEVRTAGYVGFGFSSTGAMAAADIVVGGVARGRPYLQVSAYIPSCSRPAEPPAGRDCGQAGAVGGRPGPPGFLSGGGWPPSPPSPRSLSPASATLCDPLLHPGVQGPWGWTPQLRRPAPGKLNTVNLGSFPSLNTFLPLAPHLVHAPSAHLPRTTSHP